MLRALWFLARVGLLAAGAVWLAARPGHVEIEWDGYIIETSAGFALAAILALFIVLMIVLALYRALVGMPSLFRRYKIAQSREQGYRSVTAGMVAVAAGDAAGAQKHARRALAGIPDAPLAKLLSAQALLLAGDAQKARRIFSELADDDTAAFLGLRGLLAEAENNGDYAAALLHARRAAQLQPGRSWVLRTQFALEARQRHWHEAEKVLGKAERKNVYPKEKAARARQVLLLGQAEDTQDPVRAWKIADKAFAIDAAFSPAAERLAAYLLAVGKDKYALRVIEKAWAAMPHPALAALWMQAAPLRKKTITPQDARAWAQKLHDINPGHRESARLLGSAAMEAGQWREARRLFESAGDGRALARLEDLETGGPAHARQWRDFTPEARWVCAHCAGVAAAWAPLCRDCGVFDGYEWMLADAAPRALLRAEGYDPVFPDA
jgi:HemY protein